MRLWLRLFACKEVIESEVRRRLRDSFNVTLPRFDLMAQLDRTPKGMTLGELSQRMMVSNGNVTGLVERLVEQGLIDRRPSPNDRRAQIVRLTAEGRRAFRAMATGEWRLDWRNVRRPFKRRHRRSSAPACQGESVGAARNRRSRVRIPVVTPLAASYISLRDARSLRPG